VVSGKVEEELDAHGLWEERDQVDPNITKVIPICFDARSAKAASAAHTSTQTSVLTNVHSG
jgi:hypothetical protein